MFCKYCGAQLDDDAVFCTKCGKRIVSAKANAAEEPRKAEPSKQETPATEIANPAPKVQAEAATAEKADTAPKTAPEAAPKVDAAPEVQATPVQEPEKSELEKLLEVEAERHAAEVQYKIGECYYNGEGGAEKDFAKAAEWFEKAVWKGHANAQAKLGAMYENGTGVEKDLSKAKQWYKMALGNGVMFAKIALEKLEQEENAFKPKHFCKNCGKEIAEGTRFCQYCGTDQQAQSYTYSASSNIASSNISSASSPKSKTTLLVLFFLLNGFGVHYFYVGRTGLGILRLSIIVISFFLAMDYQINYNNTSLSFAFILYIVLFIWWIFELVAMIKNEFKDKDGRAVTN